MQRGLGGLLGQVAEERRHRAAFARRVAMFRAEVVLDDGLACRFAVAQGLGPLPPALGRLLETAVAGFGRQGFLGLEMPIETAMGQARGAHHFDQAEAFQATLTKQPGSGVGDAFAVEFGLFARDAGHDGLLKGYGDWCSILQVIDCCKHLSVLCCTSDDFPQAGIHWVSRRVPAVCMVRVRGMMIFSSSPRKLCNACTAAAWTAGTRRT